MGYSSNKKFSTATDMIGVIIDGCGNTHEDKYYVNGAYIDLCGLSVKDYMNNPCCGNNGGNSNSGSNNGKVKNIIKVESYELDGKIYYQATATYPVTSILKIRVGNSDTETITELDLFPGEIKSNPEIGDSLHIKDISVDVTEDDNFQYTPTNGNEDNGTESPEEMTYTIYVATLHIDEIKTLNDESIKQLESFLMNGGSTVDLKYIISGTDVEINGMEMDEFYEFCEKNQHAFVLILPKKIYDSNSYTLINYGGSNVTSNFVKESDYLIDSEEYVCIIEKAKGDIMPYVPLYKEDLVYEYKLTIKK